jgi:Crinkler effector protein N-terminal domain
MPLAYYDLSLRDSDGHVYPLRLLICCIFIAKLSIVTHLRLFREIPSAEKIRKLFCWVNGDEYSQAFPVEIEGTKTVGDLKKVIKKEKENAFQHVDADNLQLWKVSLLCWWELGLTWPLVGQY